MSVAIGLAASQSQVIATVHFAATMILVIYAGLFARRLSMAVFAAGYVGGCDVFWRMTQASAPWEASKYALTFVALTAMVRFVRAPRRLKGPLLLLVLLVPGALLTVSKLGPSAARDQLSGTLMALVALAALVAFCRQLFVRADEMSTLLWCCVAPVVSIAVVATRATVLAGDTLKFTDESNFVTSGGFGPNQVSLALGYGALCCFAVALIRLPIRERLLAAPFGLWFVGVALLSFSRGGIYTFVVGVAAAGVAALLTRGIRSRGLTGLLVAALGAVMVFSWVNTFSGGKLEDRFADTSTANRGEIAERDLEVFYQNPVLGIGVGLANDQLGATLSRKSSVHTEYTRLLAEHGLLGIGEVAVLFGMAITSLRSATEPANRLIATSMCVFTFVAMTHAGTRIGMIPLAFALAALRFERPSVPVPKMSHRQPADAGH